MHWGLFWIKNLGNLPLEGCQSVFRLLRCVSSRTQFSIFIYCFLAFSFLSQGLANKNFDKLGLNTRKVGNFNSRQYKMSTKELFDASLDVNLVDIPYTNYTSDLRQLEFFVYLYSHLLSKMLAWWMPDNINWTKDNIFVLYRAYDVLK